MAKHMTARAWRALIVVAALAGSGARAQPPAHGHAPAPHAEHYDTRYSHNHYYAERGIVYHQVPGRPVVIPHAGVHYYYSGGVWYAPHGPQFIVVAPPVGVFVPVLPPYYTTIWFAGVPYYYANDTYYSYRGDEGYQVVDPPGDRSMDAPPPSELPPAEGAPEESGGVPPEAAPPVTAGVGTATEELFIYPQSGQPAEQQASDKYECHQWAVSQTGFDPTQSAGGVPPDQLIAKRADYQRAMSACLVGRGYSVR